MLSPATDETCTARGQRAARVYSALLGAYRDQVRDAATAYIVDAPADGRPMPLTWARHLRTMWRVV